MVLSPHLAKFDICFMGPILAAHSNSGGSVHRGGSGKYEVMHADLVNQLKRHKQADVRFTTMFDLYALHKGFPGDVEAKALLHNPEERVRVLEAAFGADIGDPRLVPHIQLHEFETILLCQPEAFELVYEDCGRAVAALRGLVDAEGPPERIDDGPMSAPSKRIAAHFPAYPGGKLSAGVEIASCIDLALVRSKCPHFDRWITALEALGQPAT